MSIHSTAFDAMRGLYDHALQWFLGHDLLMLLVTGVTIAISVYLYVIIPKGSQNTDYEVELGIVIGSKASYIAVHDAAKHIAGYCVVNDVSEREYQMERGGQWTKGKSCDTFCPLGPWLVTADEVPNPNALRLRTILNGKVMQDHTTADMIFDVPMLIESLSSTMTLRPGSIILTGTPPGVGFARNPPVWLKAGDRFVVEIEKIGALENPVTNEL